MTPIRAIIPTPNSLESFPKSSGQRALSLTLAYCLILIFQGQANAAELKGEIVGVTDGDTVTLLDAHNQQVKIRLAGIDAPERKQPYGEKAKLVLSEMVYRQQVLIEWFKVDRYGRVIGKIISAGNDTNLEMIRAGLAWHYKKYASEQLQADRESYARAETEARLATKGLWTENNPVPPWDWRKK
jgi:endonuclease YncB( thermonuclease family)